MTSSVEAEKRSQLPSSGDLDVADWSPAMTAAATSQRELDPSDPRLAEPIFTLSETATYLALPTSTIRSWARPSAGIEPLFTCDPRQGNKATVPFVGFAEAYVLSSLRKAGVPMQRIRPAVETLKAEIGLHHALASKRLFTDGAEVLFAYANEAGDPDLEALTVVRDNQKQFTRTVQNYLRRLEYGIDGFATKVRLKQFGNTEVIVDPEVSFGVPSLAGTGIRVEDLVDRFKAGDSVDLLASDFSVEREQVEDVIRIATQAA